MKKVRSYDSPICFGHHSPREGGANESLHQALGELEGRETAPEPVMIIDAAKGLKADPGALLSVFGRYLSKSHRLFHGGRGRLTHDASFCRPAQSGRVYGCDGMRAKSGPGDIAGFSNTAPSGAKSPLIGVPVA